jgi:hypothetical protein
MILKSGFDHLVYPIVTPTGCGGAFSQGKSLKPFWSMTCEGEVQLEVK